jgi:hypothetical protein
MFNLIAASACFLLIHFGVSGTRLRDARQAVQIPPAGGNSERVIWHYAVTYAQLSWRVTALVARLP